MALELVVDKVDALPEAVRGLYVEKEGKFHLDVNGVPDVSKMQAALQSERERAATLDRSIKEWAKLGKKPEEVDAMLQAERQKAEDAAIKAGKFDEVISNKLGEAKRERDAAVEAESKKTSSALAVARKAVVDTGLSTALAKAKATEEGLAALPKLLADRVKVEFNDAHEAVHSIFDADGKTPLFSEGGKPGTFDDLVKQAIKTFPSLFEGSGAGGAGVSGKGGTRAGQKEMSRADFQALSPADQMARMKDGWKLTEK